MNKQTIANAMQAAGAASVSLSAFFVSVVLGLFVAGICVAVAGVIVERD
jgi:hypothetical protein